MIQDVDRDPVCAIRDDGKGGFWFAMPLFISDNHENCGQMFSFKEFAPRIQYYKWKMQNRLRAAKLIYRFRKVLPVLIALLQHKAEPKPKQNEPFYSTHFKSSSGRIILK